MIRFLTFFFLIFFSSSVLIAYPIDIFFADPPAPYLRQYYYRMNLWYFDTFILPSNRKFDFDEIRLLKQVEQNTSEWSTPVESQNLLNIQYIHKVDGGKYNHQAFQFRVDFNDPNQKRILKQIFQKNKIPLIFLSRVKFLKTDLLNETTEIQTIEDLQGIKDIQKLALIGEKVNLKNYKKSIILHRVYQGGREIDTGITFFPVSFLNEYLTKYPFYPAIMDLRRRIYASGIEEEELELRAFNLIYLSPEGRRFAVLHQRELAQIVHRIVWKSKDNYTIYYP